MSSTARPRGSRAPIPSTHSCTWRCASTCAPTSRVCMFIGYGDTDTWQHMGRYDNFLETAHSFDGYMAELWRQIQSSPGIQGSDHADHLHGSRARQWARGVERPRHRAEGLEQYLDRGDRAGHAAARRATQSAGSHSIADRRDRRGAGRRGLPRRSIAPPRRRFSRR